MDAEGDHGVDDHRNDGHQADRDQGSDDPAPGSPEPGERARPPERGQPGSQPGILGDEPPLDLGEHALLVH
jgi:hypothetical protein